MDKKTFIVYSDWEDKLSLLSDEELGKIFRYIFKYVKTGSIPKMKRELLMIFNILKYDLDKNFEQYQKRCEANKINGKKGGRPKKRNNPLGFIKTEETQHNPQKHDSDSDSDNDNKTDLLLTTTIYGYIEENFGRTLSSLEVIKIDEWLLSFNKEIIKYAIEKAVLNNKRTFSYVDGILKNWKSCNFKTLQEIKDTEIKHDNKSTQNVSIEKWLDVDIPENSASDEEIKNLEKRMNRE